MEWISGLSSDVILLDCLSPFGLKLKIEKKIYVYINIKYKRKGLEIISNLKKKGKNRDKLSYRFN